MNGQSDPIALLAELAARMRPGWTLDAVKAALADPFVMRKDFPAVVAAVGVCYGDPGTKAPGRLTVDGPWWHLTSTGTPQPGRFVSSAHPGAHLTAEQLEARRARVRRIAAEAAGRDLMGCSDLMGTHLAGGTEMEGGDA